MFGGKSGPPMLLRPHLQNISVSRFDKERVYRVYFQYVIPMTVAIRFAFWGW